MKLVEGAGFFCFLHDDVALDPSTISELVAETYRSNAGIVGPKLVDWDRPERPAARRAQRRPGGRDARHGRGRRARPGAARRRARRLLRPDGVPARPHRPVPRPRRLRAGHRLLRRRPRPVLAGAPVGRPRARRARRPGPAPGAPARAPPRPRRARRCPSATGCAPPCRRPPGSTWSACIGLPRPVHRDRAPSSASSPGGPARSGDARGLALAARAPAGAVHPPPPLPAPSARSRTPRWPACRACADRPGSAAYRRQRAADREGQGDPAGRARGRPAAPARRRGRPGQRRGLGGGPGRAARRQPRAASSAACPQAGELLAWPAGPVRARAGVPRRLVVAGPGRHAARPDRHGPVRRARPRSPSAPTACPGPCWSSARCSSERSASGASPAPSRPAGPPPRPSACTSRLRWPPTRSAPARSRASSSTARCRGPCTGWPGCTARHRSSTRPTRNRARRLRWADVVVLGVLAGVVGAFVPVYPLVMVGSAARPRHRLARSSASGPGSGSDAARERRRRARSPSCSTCRGRSASCRRASPQWTVLGVAPRVAPAPGPAVARRVRLRTAPPRRAGPRPDRAADRRAAGRPLLPLRLGRPRHACSAVAGLGTAWLVDRGTLAASPSLDPGAPHPLRRRARHRRGLLRRRLRPGRPGHDVQLAPAARRRGAASRVLVGAHPAASRPWSAGAGSCTTTSASALLGLLPAAAGGRQQPGAVGRCSRRTCRCRAGRWRTGWSTPWPTTRRRRCGSAGATEPTRAEQLVAEDIDLAASSATDRLGRLIGPMGVRFVLVPVDPPGLRPTLGRRRAEPAGPPRLARPPARPAPGRARRRLARGLREHGVAPGAGHRRPAPRPRPAGRPAPRRSSASDFTGAVAGAARPAPDGRRRPGPGRVGAAVRGRRQSMGADGRRPGRRPAAPRSAGPRPGTSPAPGHGRVPLPHRGHPLRRSCWSRSSSGCWPWCSSGPGATGRPSAAGWPGAAWRPAPRRPSSTSPRTAGQRSRQPAGGAARAVAGADRPTAGRHDRPPPPLRPGRRGRWSALLVADQAEPEPVPPSTYGEAPLAQSTPAVFDGEPAVDQLVLPRRTDRRTAGPRRVTLFNTHERSTRGHVSAVTDGRHASVDAAHAAAPQPRRREPG